MPFFKIENTTKTFDFIGGIIFIGLGWAIFYFINDEINITNPKSGIFLFLQWIAVVIGKCPFIIIMNLIGLFLIVKGLRKNSLPIKKKVVSSDINKYPTPFQTKKQDDSNVRENIHPDSGFMG